MFALLRGWGVFWVIDTLSLWSIENLTAMVRLIVRMLPIITCHISLLAEAISIEVVVKTQ